MRRSTADHLDRIIGLTTHGRQRDRAILVALVLYTAVWTLYGVVANGSRNVHPDMAELIAWSRDLALGFPKHPPFAAVVVRGWFAWFPITDWAYYLLAVVMASSALWFAWKLFADYLSPTKRLAALCLLTFIPFFNFHALKFNVNTVLMPLWAVTTLWFLRSYRTRSLTYAALTGIGAALCILTKYWSICLLAGFAIAAISDSRRRAYFLSWTPWITALTTLALISPHIGWLEKHNFSSIQYAMVVHGHRSRAQVVLAAIRYCLDSAAFASVAIAATLFFTRPHLKVVADMAWPADRDRRLAVVVFWGTLLFPIVPAVLSDVEIDALWTMSAWTLLPVLLLASPSVHLSHRSARWIAGAAGVFPMICLAVSPLVAYALFAQGLPADHTQSRLLTQKIEEAWHAATKEPLRYVGGSASYGVVAYAHDRPQALDGLPPPNAQRLRDGGMVLICHIEESECISQAAARAAENPKSQRIETQIVSTYSGLVGARQRYVFFVVPPEL